MWKIILWILGKTRESYTRVVEYGNEIFIIKINKFVSADEEIEEWENALEEPRASD